MEIKINNLIRLIKSSNVSFVENDTNLIYKYRDWNKQSHKETLTKHEIWMSSAEKFLDKEDTDFRLRWDLLKKYDWFKRGNVQFKRQGYNKESANKYSVIEGSENYENAKNPDYLNEINRKYKLRVNKEFGIFSTANSPSSKFLWNEYADNYAGFCIGYDPEILCQSGLIIFPVLYYTNSYPIVIPSSIDDNSDLLASLLLKRKELYFNEQEFRAFTYRQGGLIKRNIEINPQAIKEIVIGSNCSENNMKDIISISLNYPNVVLYKLIREKENIFLTPI